MMSVTSCVSRFTTSSLDCTDIAASFSCPCHRLPLVQIALTCVVPLKPVADPLPGLRWVWMAWNPASRSRNHSLVPSWTIRLPTTQCTTDSSTESHTFLVGLELPLAKQSLPDHFGESLPLGWCLSLPRSLGGLGYSLPGFWR